MGGCQIFVAGGVSKNFGGADVSTIFLKVGWQNFGVSWQDILKVGLQNFLGRWGGKIFGGGVQKMLVGSMAKYFEAGVAKLFRGKTAKDFGGEVA